MAQNRTLLNNVIFGMCMQTTCIQNYRGWFEIRKVGVLRPKYQSRKIAIDTIVLISSLCIYLSACSFEQKKSCLQ